MSGALVGGVKAVGGNFAGGKVEGSIHGVVRGEVSGLSNCVVYTYTQNWPLMLLIVSTKKPVILTSLRLFPPTAPTSLRCRHQAILVYILHSPSCSSSFILTHFMTTTAIPGLLTQEQFDQYSAKWLEVVENANPADLQSCLAASTSNKLLWFVSFPIQRIVQLVSVVGGQRIKARFLVIPQQDELHFTIALFVTGAQDARLSAYYVADTPPQPQGLEAQVPHDLVKTWLNNWHQLATVTPDLFQTADGPLRGYSFELADFLEPLFRVQPFAEQQMHLNFGLHEYYSPTPVNEALTRTFGLALRIYDSNSQDALASSEPIFDVSMPCPPTC
jgi:hypothetical protein